MDFAARYRLERVAHKGTLGTLYVAEQLALRRTVLVRIVAKEIAYDPVRRKQLVEHIERLSRVDDKSVVPILDFGEIDDVPFYVMERQEGIDLKTAAIGEHSIFEIANPPTLAQRATALRDFLRSCKKLGDGLIQLKNLRTADVLLAPPFRFVLTEPGLSGASKASPTDNTQQFQEVLQRAFELTLDPAWDSKEKPGTGVGPARLRLTIFQSLSHSRQREPEELIDVALESLREIVRPTVSTRSGSKVDPLHRSTIAAVVKRSRKAVATISLVTLSMFGCGLVAYSALLKDQVLTEAEMYKRLAEATNRHDTSELALLADPLTGAPQAVQETAKRELREAWTELLDRDVGLILDRIPDNTAPLLPDRHAISASALPHEFAQQRKSIDDQATTHERLLRLILSTQQMPETNEAFQQLCVSNLHPALLRSLCLRLLKQGRQPLASNAAQAIGLGYIEQPKYLDDQLATLLHNPDTEPAIALALVGYFSDLPAERGLNVLRRTVLARADKAMAPNPDLNPFATNLCMKRNGNANVLQAWIGPGYSQGEGNPTAANRYIPIRAAALFALEKPAMDASRMAIQLGRESLWGERGLREAISLQLIRHAAQMSDQELEEVLQQTMRSGMIPALKPVLGTLAARAPGKAKECLLESIRQRKAPLAVYMPLLKTAHEVALIQSLTDLVPFFEALPIENIHLAARVTADSRAFTEFIAQATPERIPEGARLALALVRAACAATKPEDVDLLCRTIRNPTGIPWHRMQALRSLTTVQGDEVIECLQEVIEDTRQPDDLRLLAIAVAKEKLGSPSTSFLDLKLTVQHLAFAAPLLRSMSTTLNQDCNLMIRRVAAQSMAAYESGIVMESLLQHLSPQSEKGLLEIAADYFSEHIVDQESGDDIDTRIVALLESDDVAERVKALAVDYLTTNKRSQHQQLVQAMLEDLMDEDAVRSAIRYLADNAADPTSYAALLSFCDSNQSLDIRLQALDTVQTRILTQPDSPHEQIADMYSSSEEPRIVFACASILNAKGHPLDPGPLATALSRHAGSYAATGLSDSTNPSSSSSRYSMSSDSRTGFHSTQLGSPRIVLQLSADGLESKIVNACIDRELDGTAFRIVATALALRLAKAEATSTELDRLLKWKGLDISSFTEAVAEMSDSSYGPILDQDAYAVLSYVCGPAYEGRHTQKMFAVKAHFLLDVGYRLTGDASDSYLNAILDLERAISIASDEERPELLYDLYRAYRSNDEPEKAISALARYHQGAPENAEAAYELFDEFMAVDRPADAEAILNSISSRDPDYWQRKLMLEFLSPEKGLRFVEQFSQRPEWRDSRVFAVMPSILSHIFDHRRDDKFLQVRQRATERLAHALRNELSSSHRAMAAFHLSWLDPLAAQKDLQIAATTDPNPLARRHALWGLARAKPEEAAGVALHTLNAAPDPEALASAFWVLSSVGHPDRISRIAARVNESDPNAPLAVAILCTMNNYAAIENMHRMMRSENAGARMTASTGLSVLGARGAAVDREIMMQCFLHERDDDMAQISGTALARMGDANILSECSEEIGDFTADRMTSSVSLIRMPLIAQVLSAHTDKEAARALITSILEHRKQQLNIARNSNPKRLPELAATYERSQDDERLGDLGDRYLLAGMVEEAIQMYEKAATIAPRDYEWQEKLRQARTGKSSDIALSVVSDSILKAAVIAMAKIAPESEADPIEDYKDQGSYTGLDPDTRDLWINAFKRWCQQKKSRSDTPMPPDLRSRLQPLIACIDAFPQFLTARWIEAGSDIANAYSRSYSYQSDLYAYEADRGLFRSALYYSDMKDFYDMFGSRMPIELSEAMRLLSALEDVGGALATGTESDSLLANIEALRKSTSGN
jgi:tetratricopeptide (TPR) repeat protein